MENTMSDMKKVWVINVDTKVKYLINEDWYLRNTNQFSLTEAPTEANEEPEAIKEKAIKPKKAKVDKRVSGNKKTAVKKTK